MCGWETGRITERYGFDMAEKVTEFFGIDVFNEAVMRERLPKTTFKALKKTMENGEEHIKQAADIIADDCNDFGAAKILEQIIESKK